jgi:hypothetical protein
MIYEHVSRNSCPRSWRPYASDLRFTAAPQYYDVPVEKSFYEFDRSNRDGYGSNYTTSPSQRPMRPVERHRFSGKQNTSPFPYMTKLTWHKATSGIAKPSRRSGLPWDPVRDDIIV